MRMPTIPLVVSFLTALVVAQNACTGNKSDVAHCTTLSITDVTLTATGPPTVNECYETCRIGVFGDAGDWMVDFTGMLFCYALPPLLNMRESNLVLGHPAGYIDNMVGFPCGFSVGRGAGEPLNYKFFMGNQDIGDILDSVTTMFGGLHGGKVAAQGTMVCDGHQATWFVN